ncbi:MAG: hypothetical protein WDO71_23815 [Bacteroidota bacterium]
MGSKSGKWCNCNHKVNEEKTGKPQIEFTANSTFQKRPDLFNVNVISSSDYIDLEKYLFSNGYYNVDEIYNRVLKVPRPFTPVLELLIAKRDGLIPATQADSQIETYKAFDARNDIKKYLYRSAISQQHSINISGATPSISYYVSGGWDHNLGIGNLVGTQFDRISLRSQNSLKITNRFQIDAGLSSYTKQ